MGESYSCASGGVIAAGCNYINSYAALMGDSLTDDAYGMSNFYYFNGALGGKMKLLTNAGRYGDHASDMLARVNNLYTAASPGLAGLPMLGRLFLRVGTNDLATPITSNAATYTALLNALAAYATKVCILAVPPTGNANNPSAMAYNAWLQAFAAAHPAKFIFIDDMADLRNGDGSQKSAYFLPDGIHFAPGGVAQAGETAAALLAAEMAAYPSPVSRDPADVYPAQPQWFTNPAMLGSGGSKASGFTGQVVNGLAIQAYGGGMACDCSIVAADAGDPYQIPWQRLTISSGVDGNSAMLSAVPVGRTITAVDPPQGLEIIIEMRIVNLDTSMIEDINTRIVSGSGEYLSGAIHFWLPNAGRMTKTYVIRAPNRRSGTFSSSSSIWMAYVVCRQNFGPAADIGYIDFRSITIRG